MRPDSVFVFLFVVSGKDFLSVLGYPFQKVLSLWLEEGADAQHMQKEEEQEEPKQEEEEHEATSGCKRLHREAFLCPCQKKGLRRDRFDSDEEAEGGGG